MVRNEKFFLGGKMVFISVGLSVLVIGAVFAYSLKSPPVANKSVPPAVPADGGAVYRNRKYRFQLSFSPAWQFNEIAPDENVTFTNKDDGCEVSFAKADDSAGVSAGKGLSSVSHVFAAGGKNYSAEWSERNNAVVRLRVFDVPDNNAKHKLEVYSSKGATAGLDSKCVEDLRTVLGTLMTL